MRLTFVHSVVRVCLAFVFAYHGLVPKLLVRHADEIAILRDIGVQARLIGPTVTAAGIAELGFALCLILFWHRRWPLWLCLGVMVMATLSVAVSAPRYLSAAFNPVSLNLAVGCLATIDLIVLSAVPSAARCRRRPAPETA